MDLISLAFNYLISVCLGISVDTLFSRYFTADKNIQDNLNNQEFDYHLDIFDFIVVGGGTAGCVVANRLSGHNYKVLLLEAGGNPFPLTLVPSMAPRLLGNTNVDWAFTSVPQKNAFKAFTNNTYTISQGKGLGGSGMLNFNAFMRGSPYDYEEWANMTGDLSWSYENLLPYFKTMESYYGYFDKNFLHGQNGPMHIETPKYFPMRQEWLEAGSELGLRVKDPNGFQTESVFSIDTSTKRGRKFSTHRGYLYPVLGRPNLKVVTYAEVQKIVFNEKNKAVSVSYSHRGKMLDAIASREIILSAGAISTPKILMLSGIGPKEHLESVGVTVIKDLPVGKNLRDHFAAFVGPFIVNKGNSIRADRDFNSEALHSYLEAGVGPYSTSGFGVGALFSSTLATSRDWPDIYLNQWVTGLNANVSSNERRFFGVNTQILEEYVSADLGSDSFMISVTLSKPKSSGEVTLASSDANVNPIVDANFLSNADDIKVIVEGIQKSIKMVTKTKAFENIGVRLTNSLFPGCEELAKLSDEYWECFARHFCGSMSHLVGTCRMGKATGDSGAVVDSRLRVLGTTGLRVIDASVMPQVTTTNTYAPTIMIAEKGAHMIIEDWGKPILIKI